MKRASITETKNHLSALIAAVKRGETILIMERGRPVARLEPVGTNEDEDVEARLARLERAGIVKRSKTTKPNPLLLKPPPKLKSGASVLQALLEEREEGR